MYWLLYSSPTSHHPSQTPCLPWISYTTQKLILDSCKILQKQSEAFHTFLWHFFPSVKQNVIAYRSSKVSSHPDCIFEIHQLWQSSFSGVYFNSFCRCSFESEIIKIGLSSRKMYSNNILNFQDSLPVQKCLETYWRHHVLSKKLLILVTIYENAQNSLNLFWCFFCIMLILNSEHAYFETYTHSLPKFPHIRGGQIAARGPYVAHWTVLCSPRDPLKIIA